MIKLLPVAPAKTPLPEATLNVPHACDAQTAPLTESRRVLLATLVGVSLRVPVTPRQPFAGGGDSSSFAALVRGVNVGKAAQDRLEAVEAPVHLGEAGLDACFSRRVVFGRGDVL